MNTEQFLASIANTFATMHETISRKNADYADDSDPFKNFKYSKAVGVDVLRGILVRTQDKVVRAGNLCVREAQVKDEPLEECFKDIIGYAAIALAYIESQK